MAHLARDFELERDLRPYEFDYQSLHYVVRSTLPFEFGGQQIPADIPCEVQIRTLLQHAYSELTHDTIYKPNARATPPLKRTAAKSMALIEATSDYFSSLNRTIQQTLAETRKLAQFLADKYVGIFGAESTKSPLNSLLIDHYCRFAGGKFEEEFEVWWRGKSFLAKTINARRSGVALYRTPAILLLYYCASVVPILAKRDSPLTERELQPIYSDLGLALNG